MKRLLIAGLAAAIFCAAPALALTTNHTYTVQLYTVSDAGQQTLVDQMETQSDGNGRLNFQFANVPDTATAPFLMVQIMEPAGSQQPVRQTLVPAPQAGQQMAMGVDEVNSRQTQAALQAMQSANSNTDAALQAMLPLAMVPSGAISAADTANIGQMAVTGAAAFQNYLAGRGASTTQLTSFRDAMLDAMRQFAASSQNIVQQGDPVTAAGLYGQANAQFMAALMDAGTAAGIDPEVLSAAFDQAGQAMNSSPAFIGLSGDVQATVENNYLAGTHQRQLMAQLSGYAEALPVVGANGAQIQTFSTARTTFQAAMFQAMGSFQQTFADPTTLPDRAAVDQALTSMETVMQGAFGQFDQATTASQAQVDSMLNVMASQMGGAGGMMGGGMMSGSNLAQMGIGMMQTSPGGTTRNWSTMMVAASDLVPSVPGMSYAPATSDLLTQLGGAPIPAAPDWSQLPAGPDKSLLQLQYDLMLVHLIDMQALAALPGPPTQAELAAISDQDLANRATVRLGLQGLTTAQADAMLAALSTPQFLL